MLILRKENFGGIVFNTKNGHQLSLDKDGYFLLNKIVLGEKIDKQAEKDFLINLFEELELDKNEKNKYLKFKLPSIGKYNFEVLSAPTLVDLQITTKCNLSCPHCYANSSLNGKHISLKEVKRVIQECQKMGVFEIALGGGEPTMHPDFEKILKMIRKSGIVPSLASNGKDLSEENLEAIKKYCGAMALSIEFIGKEFEKRRGFAFAGFLKTVQKIKEKNIKLVFQLTISKSNYQKLKEIVKFLLKLSPYGIVFLTYKPAGRGEVLNDVLYNEDQNKVVKNIKESFALMKGKTKAGYDCCLANLLIGRNLADDKLINGCSATRSSLAINLNLDVVPCSFISKPLGNLKQETLAEIWRNKNADLFRNKFKNKIEKNPLCSQCEYKTNCLGGCPEFDLVKCGFEN